MVPLDCLNPLHSFSSFPQRQTYVTKVLGVTHGGMNNQIVSGGWLVLTQSVGRTLRASQDTIFNVFPLRHHGHLGYSRQSCVHVHVRTRVSPPACGICIMHYVVVCVSDGKRACYSVSTSRYHL